MELTPELLLEAKFSAARRGYDMAEVDDFLERCAEGLDVLLARLRSEFDRAERAEANLTALRGGEAAVEQVPSTPLPAEQEPDGTEAEPAEAVPAPDAPIPVGEPMRILIHAERTAEAAIAEATAEAARIRSEAEAVATTQRSEAETLLERARAEAEAEARRAGDETRAAIQGEVVVLRRDRDALTDDIRLLRRWLDEQRGRLRSTARDLQRLADDPTALRDVPVPEMSGAPHDEVIRDDENDDVPVFALDEGGTSDGEPTQAVPAFSIEAPFDDEDEHGERPSES